MWLDTGGQISSTGFLFITDHARAELWLPQHAPISPRLVPPQLPPHRRDAEAVVAAGPRKGEPEAEPGGEGYVSRRWRGCASQQPVRVLPCARMLDKHRWVPGEPCRTRRRPSSEEWGGNACWTGAGWKHRPLERLWPGVLAPPAQVSMLADSGHPLPITTPSQAATGPEVKTSCWQQWRRRRQTVGRRLGEAARRLTRGCGLWEGGSLRDRRYDLNPNPHLPPPPLCTSLNV